MSLNAISSKPLSYVPEDEKGKPDAFEVIFRPLTKATADQWRSRMDMKINPDKETVEGDTSKFDLELWRMQIVEIRNFIFRDEADPRTAKGDEIVKVYEQIDDTVGSDITKTILSKGHLTERQSKNLPLQSGPLAIPPVWTARRAEQGDSETR